MNIIKSAFQQATSDFAQKESDKRLDKALRKNPRASVLFTKVSTMREVERLLPYGWRLMVQDSAHHTFLGTGVSASTFLLAHDNPNLALI